MMTSQENKNQLTPHQALPHDLMGLVLDYAYGPPNEARKAHKAKMHETLEERVDILRYMWCARVSYTVMSYRTRMYDMLLHIHPMDGAHDDITDLEDAPRMTLDDWVAQRQARRVWDGERHEVWTLQRITDAADQLASVR